MNRPELKCSFINVSLPVFYFSIYSGTKRRGTLAALKYLSDHSQPALLNVVLAVDLIMFGCFYLVLFLHVN